MDKYLREMEREEKTRRRADRLGIRLTDGLLVGAVALMCLCVWNASGRQLPTEEAQAAVIVKEHAVAIPETTAPPVVVIEVDTETETIPPAEGILEAEPVPETKAETWECIGVFKTTGYCNCRKCAGRWAGGPTASGAMPEEGVTIAVDERVIPLGTHVMIGGKEYIAQDTGVHGKHIDVYYQDHGEAWEHGTQKAKVYVRK